MRVNKKGYIIGVVVVLFSSSQAFPETFAVKQNGNVYLCTKLFKNIVMDAVELSKTLRESARQNGLCDQWYDEWKDDCSEAALAEKMFKGLDFCIKHHWPSNEFIKDNFSLEFRRKVNVFVDDSRSVVNPEQSLVLGTSNVTLRYNGNSHGNIYVRDNSKVTVTAKNRSFVIVHLFDNSHVEASQFDSARIVLIRHSQDVTFIAGKNVTIKEELDYLKN